MLKKPSGLAETDAREVERQRDCLQFPLPSAEPGTGQASWGLRQVRLTEVGVAQAGLPVRSPGAHLHPLLRRPPVAGGCGAG